MKPERITGLSVEDDSPIAVWFSDGMIRKVEKIPAMDLDDPNAYLAPGLIDNQVNGFKGIDFCAPDLDVEQVRKTVLEMWRLGATTFIPTLITMPEEQLIHSLHILSEAMVQDDIGPSMPGVHLEGPYISSEPGYRGAHNPEWIRPPDWEEFQRLQSAAGSKITQITMAPEIPGALEFIERCSRNKIVVALGHHAAPAEIIHRAAEAGAAVSTHLGNACANMIDRHNNVLWPQLADDNLMATIIADGHHLTPDELRVLYRVKGPDNLILVSDLVAFGGVEPGEYPWNGKILTVTENGTVGVKGEQILAGATFPLKEGVANMMRYAGCSLAQSLGLATRNPAKLNRLFDRGTLHPGYRADMIRFKMLDNRLQINETWVGGHCVLRREV